MERNSAMGANRKEGDGQVMSKADQLTVRFQDWDCRVEFLRYENGRPALILRDITDGEEVTVATVNIPDVALAQGEVLIKDYSENAGMLAALENAGIVKATGRRIESGFVSIPVVELLVSSQEQQRGKKSLADLKAEGQRKQPARQKAREKGRGR